MHITLQTKGNTDIIDITPQVEEKLQELDLQDGAILLFTKSSTSTLTTLEYEDGVLEDLKQALEKVAPQDAEYKHNAKWGDGNGYAHIRAALMKPSLTIPVENGKLQLGTWQQIVFIDFDNKPHERKILIKPFQ